MFITKTHTGKIYTCPERQLEFLTVGDYGKENNIKAEFLGYTKEINGVKNTSVDLSKKWVATISTQKGCPMKCKFCDVPLYGYHGNCSKEDLEFQIKTIIGGETISHTNRFNVHYARMGEPTLNPNVLSFTSDRLDNLIKECGLTTDVIHPVVSTMLPKGVPNLFNYITEWCHIKNELRNGEAGLQFSINSTDDEQRKYQFSDKSLSLNEVSRICCDIPDPLGRKYTLNFAVTEETILDAMTLNRMFDKEKFIVKLTPIHKTKSSSSNKFDTTTSYEDYNVYSQFEKPLLSLGWDVIVFVPSVEEDSDRITCGNAIISTIN